MKFGGVLPTPHALEKKRAHPQSPTNQLIQQKFFSDIGPASPKTPRQPGRSPLLDDRPLRGNQPPHTQAGPSTQETPPGAKPDQFAGVRDGRVIGGGKRSHPPQPQPRRLPPTPHPLLQHNHLPTRTRQHSCSAAWKASSTNKPPNSDPLHPPCPHTNYHNQQLSQTCSNTL